jgi:hypothetical protein
LFTGNELVAILVRLAGVLSIILLVILLLYCCGFLSFSSGIFRRLDISGGCLLSMHVHTCTGLNEFEMVDRALSSVLTLRVTHGILNICVLGARIGSFRTLFGFVIRAGDINPLVSTSSTANISAERI